MKLLLLLWAVVIGVSASITPGGEVFDQLDIQDIFDNDDKRREAYNCLMDRAPCGKYQIIKEKCPSIIKNDCANCSLRQKQKYHELMKKLELEHNEEYREINKKFKNVNV